MIITPKARPDVLEGKTEKLPKSENHGSLYVTVNFDPETKEPFEVFAQLGKTGGCDRAQGEAITRLISLCLRSGVDASVIVDQLRGITCCSVWINGTLVKSPADGIALVLSKYVKKVSATVKNEETNTPSS